MSQMPSYDRTRHTLPRVHVVVPRHQGYTESGMMHAVVTIPSRDLREAITIRELARQTPVQVPTSIDTRDGDMLPRGGCSHAATRLSTRGRQQAQSSTDTGASRAEAQPRRTCHVDVGLTCHERMLKTIFTFSRLVTITATRMLDSTTTSEFAMHNSNTLVRFIMI